MTNYFILKSDRGGLNDFRLLSYSGAVKGSKVVLTLKVEVEGLWMHDALSSLEAIQNAHKPKPAPKRQPKLKPLALPAPSLALPTPSGDTSRKGADRDAYEDWLEQRTGKRSAGQLTTDERIAFVKALRREGLIPEAGRGGADRTAAGSDRPTSAQWAKIGALSRSMGWKGLEDPALKAFVTRTAKVSSTRFLTRAQASAVILGLETWVRQKENEAESKG